MTKELERKNVYLLNFEHWDKKENNSGVSHITDFAFILVCTCNNTIKIGLF